MELNLNSFTFAFVLKNILFSLLIVLSSVVLGQTQRPEVEKNVLRNTVLIGATYGRQVALGDFRKRFGGSNTIGLNFSYKFGKNYQISGNFCTHFSSVVKENGVLDSIIGKNGQLLDINGNFAQVNLYQRGYLWHIDFGKVLKTSRFNQNSGILLSAGLGFMEHKIKFIHQTGVLPQLEGDNYKGYDRLSNGLLTRLFVGYQAIDPDQMLNYFAGFEFMHGFTKNRRTVNYDTRVAETNLRADQLLGIKIGLLFSIKGRKTGTKKGEEDKFFE